MDSTGYIENQALLLLHARDSCSIPSKFVEVECQTLHKRNLLSLSG